MERYLGQNIIKGIKELLNEANLKAKYIKVTDAIKLINDDNYIFIDIRDIRELKREGKVPGAFSCPRGMLEFWIDPESPYHKEIFNQDKSYIFYCASAWRSALAVKTAAEMGLSPVFHIEGGFSAWVDKDGPIEKI